MSQSLIDPSVAKPLNARMAAILTEGFKAGLIKPSVASTADGTWALEFARPGNTSVYAPITERQAHHAQADGEAGCFILGVNLAVFPEKLALYPNGDGPLAFPKSKAPLSIEEQHAILTHIVDAACSARASAGTAFDHDLPTTIHRFNDGSALLLTSHVATGPEGPGTIGSKMTSSADAAYFLPQLEHATYSRFFPSESETRKAPARAQAILAKLDAPPPQGFLASFGHLVESCKALMGLGLDAPLRDAPQSLASKLQTRREEPASTAPAPTPKTPS